MTVSEFLKTLPADRRIELKRVRDAVRKRLPKGYGESVSGKMIVYHVAVDGRPFWYAAIAAQKSYLTLHLMPVYGDRSLASRLKKGFKEAGKKLDMGKACIRFKKADDLALDVIGDIVAAVPTDRWMEIARSRARR